ncbi:hypothetical protein BDW69DRAFT_129394 [Aspergillus filifer]
MVATFLLYHMHFKPTLKNIISTGESKRLLFHSSKHPGSYYYQLVWFTTFVFVLVLSYSQVCVMAVWGTLSHPSISSPIIFPFPSGLLEINRYRFWPGRTSRNMAIFRTTTKDRSLGLRPFSPVSIL